MPIYQYRCRDCKRDVEVWLQSSLEAPICPECGARLQDKLLSAPHVARGDTARPPGMTCCGREERCESPACSTGAQCRRD